MFRGGSPGSIIRRLWRNVFITVGLLVLALTLSLIFSTLVLNNQKSLDEQGSAVRGDLDGLVRTMIDQETSVRGYVTTADTAFLEPYNTARPQYQQYLKDLQSRTRKENFNNTARLLTPLADRGEDWHNNGALAQISRVQKGGNNLSLARSDQIALENKARFDAFRTAWGSLNEEAEAELNRIQTKADQIYLLILIVLIVVGIAAIFLSIRFFSSFINNLRRQLVYLMEVTDRLEQGDLTARIANPTEDELGRLSQNFNSMATSLEEQTVHLKQRDIQENLLQLNNTLSNSLELELMISEFLDGLLRLLQLQVGAVYLYNAESGFLSIAGVQGLDRASVQPTFNMGEGMVGQVAQTRQPLYFARPSHVEAADFTLTTIVGQTIPASLYHLPLSRGKELVGVLVAGSLFPMSEQARRVLDVVGGNLAVATSNALAYRHIQSQADELDRRRHELERNNGELSRQRDELAVLNEALEEANRLRNQFLSTMSHELRTPLTAIIGFSQLLLRGNEISTFTSRQTANLERILKNGQHLLRLVNDVLDIAKIEAGRMDVMREEMDLAQFVSSIIDQTQSLATQKNIALKSSIAEGLGKLETDADKLRQVLLNLVSNAIKFTEQGEVCIGVSLREAEPGKHGASRERVVIAVKDTGIGIPPEKQEHIFDEFYQVDSSNTRKYGGTGLGLSIVRKLSELLGGQVELESQVGGGSTFTLVLPRRLRTMQSEQADLRLIPAPTSSSRPPQVPADLTTEADTSPVTPPTDIASNSNDDAEASRPAQPGKYLVLAVDDDPDVVELIQAALENTAYEVRGVSEPQKVPALVAELHPYAVTLDVMMPGSNGWQILQQLKTNPQTSMTPVIMLTVISDRSAGYVLGANDYLVKPIDRDLLLSTLDRVPFKRGVLVGAGATGSGKSEKENGRNDQDDQSYVLVVDDEADIREVLEQTLTEGGYRVRTAANGLEALRLVESNPPEAILLDLMMPELDGFEVLNRLKANPLTNSIPVIILTAKTLTRQDYERLNWGASRIIQKGSRPLPELLKELAMLLRFIRPAQN